MLLKYLLTVVSSPEQYWSMSFLWDYERLLEKYNNLLTNQNLSCLFSLRGKRYIFVPGMNVALGRELMSKVAEQFTWLHLEKLWKYRQSKDEPENVWESMGMESGSEKPPYCNASCQGSPMQVLISTVYCNSAMVILVFSVTTRVVSIICLR